MDVIAVAMTTRCKEQVDNMAAVDDEAAFVALWRLV